MRAEAPTVPERGAPLLNAVLIVAVLYWAQAVIVPVALALLLTFVLSIAVAPLQRRIGGVLAVLVVVGVTFAAFGMAGWAITKQLKGLAESIPGYQQNLVHKVRDVRWIGKGGSIERLQETVDTLQTEMEKGEKPGTAEQPVVVQAAPVSSLWGLPIAIGPWLEPLATAALVMTLVVFMLLERQNLRDRLISLFGHGHLTATTRALDEAGQRVRRYLLSQALINAGFGLSVAVGLYLIAVPYAVLWGALAAVLRFVPYVGPWMAAVAPTLVSLAAFDGWTRPLQVILLFGGLELVSNFVVESFFYAGAAGVSQVGLLIAFAFWTWLWGALGLLLATPLTVCLVVIGKYVPSLEIISTLLAEDAALDGDVSYYQRLLAGDLDEAADLLDRHAKDASPELLYDAMVVPALNYAERDRIDGRLSAEEEQRIVEASRTLVEEARGAPAAPSPGDGVPRLDARGTTAVVVGWPVRGDPDAFALEMLDALLREAPCTLEVLPAPALLEDGLRMLQERNCTVVCIADLPPSRSSKCRHLTKRLRAAMPDLTILVGRWAAPSFADEDVASLTAAGADYVATTLIETRDQLVGLLSSSANSTARRRDPAERTA